MNNDRIGKLKQLLEKDPNDSFTRYALGLELSGKGETQLAVSLFHEVIERDPSYVPAYQQLGYAYRRLQRNSEAAEILKRGIAVADQLGDHHARDEMQEAFEEMSKF